MILFACDLDNTLIHSYRHAQAEDICIECHAGKNLSYMAPTTYAMLLQLRTLLTFLPVTTRSLHQYERIQLFQKDVPPYALVSNGGLLLVNGEIDPSWKKESNRMAAHALSAMEEGFRLLKRDRYRLFSARWVDDIFIFSKSKEPEKTMQALAEHLDPNIIDINRNGNKIYLIPRQLNKGSALERFLVRYPYSFVEAAGDSLFDVPMMQIAHTCYAPSRRFLDQYLSDHPHVYFPSETESFCFTFLHQLLLRVAAKENEKAHKTEPYAPQEVSSP